MRASANHCFDPRLHARRQVTVVLEEHKSKTPMFYYDVIITLWFSQGFSSKKTKA